MVRRRFGAVATLAVLLAVAAALAVGTGGPAAAHANHMTVNTQVVGDEVVVESLFSSTAGFLVVHADDGGEPGRALGAREVGEGAGSDVRIPLDGELPAGNATLWVVLHEDDGDGEFTPADDPPVESFGSVVGTRFPARGGTPAYVVASRFGDHLSNGSVRIDGVALPAEGYLVLRADASGTPGRVVGRIALGAGSHRNVTVALNRSYLESAGDRFAVWATVYREDGDGEFDPAQRRETDDGLAWTAGDRPVTVDGAPVTSLTELRKGDGSLVNTATPGDSTTDAGSGTDTSTPEPVEVDTADAVTGGLVGFVVGFGAVVVVAVAVAAASRVRGRN